MARLSGFVLVLFAALAPTFAGQHGNGLSFEQNSNRSDRIVRGTVLGPIGETIDLPDGQTLTLGVQSSDGVVYTEHEISVAECIFDKRDACTTSVQRVLVPGGAFRKIVNGEEQIVMMEISGSIGLPLPDPGSEIVLFLKERFDGKLQPLGNRNDRLRVTREAGVPMVNVLLGSSSLLSPQGQSDPRNSEIIRSRAQAAQQPDSRAAPLGFRSDLYRDRVPVSRLSELVRKARSATPSTVDAEEN